MSHRERFSGRFWFFSSSWTWCRADATTSNWPTSTSTRPATPLPSASARHDCEPVSQRERKNGIQLNFVCIRLIFVSLRKCIPFGVFSVNNFP